MSLHYPGTHSISQEEDIPIASILSQEFNIPTFIENNARAMALAEVRHGTAKGRQNVFCVNVGHGIGSGLIIEGELYRGNALPTSGLGHLMILPSGPICYCGGRGCVEALAGGYAIAAAAMRSFNMAEGASIRKLVDGRGEKVSAEIVFQAAKAGDPMARQILTEAANYLGMGIACLISLIRPELIVLGGGVTKSGDIFLDEILRTAKMHSESKRITIPPIVVTKLTDYSSVVGAAAIAFEEMLSKGFNFSDAW